MEQIHFTNGWMIVVDDYENYKKILILFFTNGKTEQTGGIEKEDNLQNGMDGNLDGLLAKLLLLLMLMNFHNYSLFYFFATGLRPSLFAIPANSSLFLMLLRSRSP